MKRILLGLFLAGVLPCAGQVLARPGWAGSGVAPEAWWRRAVFYRIDPSRFQDSTGSGTGDLQGIVQRLDYIQSVGVDAILLDGRFDPEGLEDLVGEASRHHLRVVVAINPALAQGPRAALLNTVHGWLSAGAAGISLPRTGSAADPGYPALVASLRQMLQSLPGERVLLTDPVPGLTSPSPAPQQRSRAAQAGRGGQLVTVAAIPVASAGVAQLRAVLAGAAGQGAASGSNGLLQFGADPTTGAPNAAADAAMLLASSGAAVFDFGDELGLDLYSSGAPSVGTAQESLPVMQWTPSNRTTPPTEQTDKTSTPAKTGETEFGTYHPYQPPPRGLTGPMPPSPKVIVDANVPLALPAPDSLPGFTSGVLPVRPTSGGTLNVTTEDRDPKSLLNAYRQLIGLHHDNVTLRNGTQSMVNRDADGAVVWIRQAPAGSRTAANVVVAANLTDKPVVLTLDSDIVALGMRPGALRPLFAYSKEALTGETTEHLALPAHAVFLGEIHRTGTSSEPAAARRRGNR